MGFVLDGAGDPAFRVDVEEEREPSPQLRVPHGCARIALCNSLPGWSQRLEGLRHPETGTQNERLRLLGTERLLRGCIGKRDVSWMEIDDEG